MTPELNNETTRGPRPWHFAIGSLESRAAARMHIARLFNGRERVTFAHSIPRPDQDNSRVTFSDWQELKDGTLWRMVYAPHVWLKTGEAIPTCPECRTPFKKTREFPGMTGYRADCLERHDPDRATRQDRMRL
jgi:hypothetical protein